MQTTVVIKGAVGKTTITINLHNYFAARKMPTTTIMDDTQLLIVDAPAGSSKWLQQEMLRKANASSSR